MPRKRRSSISLTNVIGKFKRVHHKRMNKLSVQVINDILSDNLLKQVIDQAGKLCQVKQRRTLHKKDVRYALKLIAPPKLFFAIDQMAEQAIQRYRNSSRRSTQGAPVVENEGDYDMVSSKCDPASCHFFFQRILTA